MFHNRKYYKYYNNYGGPSSNMLFVCVHCAVKSTLVRYVLCECSLLVIVPTPQTSRTIFEIIIEIKLYLSSSQWGEITSYIWFLTCWQPHRVSFTPLTILHYKNQLDIVDDDNKYFIVSAILKMLWDDTVFLFWFQTAATGCWMLKCLCI